MYVPRKTQPWLVETLPWTICLTHLHKTHLTQSLHGIALNTLNIFLSPLAVAPFTTRSLLPAPTDAGLDRFWSSGLHQLSAHHSFVSRTRPLPASVALNSKHQRSIFPSRRPSTPHCGSDERVSSSPTDRQMAAACRAVGRRRKLPARVKTYDTCEKLQPWRVSR